MVTSEFVGAIMKLCQERRGVYIGMEYMEADPCAHQVRSAAQ